MPASRRVAARRDRPILALLLVPLLVLLLVMQGRWLDQLADGQRAELVALLQDVAHRTADDLRDVSIRLADALQDPVVELGPRDGALVARVEDIDEPGPGGRTTAAADGRRELLSFVLPATPSNATARRVVFDRSAVSNALLPELAERYREEHVISLAPAVEGTPPILCAGDVPADVAGPAEARAPLQLGGNRWTGLFSSDGTSWESVDGGPFVSELVESALVDGALAPSGREQAEGEAGGAEDGFALRALPAGGEAGADWYVEVRLRHGSLATELAAWKRANLLAGGGVLLLLVAGLVLFWVAEQRARRLAEKELAFVAGVSHELRTPLTVIRTAASNLERGLIEPERVPEYGELIEREASRMGSLVERVLRFSTEGASTGASMAPVDVEALLGEAVRGCRPWHDRKQFEIVIEVDADVPELIGDEAALTSAVQNLIDNAIKYGPDGQTVRVTAAAERGGAAQELIIAVADEGPGVPGAERARIFEPFERGRAVRGSSTPGSGLGLGVVAEIARAHGGRVDLTGNGRGATFSLRLPCAARHDP